jgi:hypothetical protein
MPATAAFQYCTQRQKYRTALAMIATITDKDIQNCLRSALTAHARRKFRGISTALTERLGCRLSCLPEGHEGVFQIEHAIPLKLIHNRILGIHPDGTVDHNTYDIFAKEKDIEAYVRAFMVGVLVTPQQHSLLNAQAMNDEWKWLADMPSWQWGELDHQDWNYTDRANWLRLIMSRYEDVPPPGGPLPYRPLSDFERQRVQKRKRRSHIV